jgi:hypothetical protein
MNTISDDPTINMELDNEGQVYDGITSLINGIGDILKIRIEYTDAIVLHSKNIKDLLN